MKAAVYQSYGSPSVLKIQNIEKPQIKANELLVKIAYSTVTSGDTRLRSSNFPPLFWLPARLIFGLFKPKKQVLGHEFAGVVTDIGNDVKNYAIGDRVFGTTTMLKGGAYAEYVALPEKWKNGVIAPLPKELEFQEAAALPIGGMTASYLLEKAKIKAEEKILIYGASGSVGSFALQLAKHKGAVVSTFSSASNFSWLKALGADALYDYTDFDFDNFSEGYDIVFDAVGKLGKSRAKPLLNKGGRFVSVEMLTKERENDLLELGNLAAAGHLKAHIDRSYALSEIAEAHRYVDSGRKRGNVLIEIV
jgi:NADPH:quinone reductase-like Zn-dependent oxidoreductase